MNGRHGAISQRFHKRWEPHPGGSRRTLHRSAAARAITNFLPDATMSALAFDFDSGADEQGALQVTLSAGRSSSPGPSSSVLSTLAAGSSTGREWKRCWSVTSALWACAWQPATSPRGLRHLCIPICAPRCFHCSTAAALIPSTTAARNRTALCSDRAGDFWRKHDFFRPSLLRGYILRVGETHREWPAGANPILV